MENKNTLIALILVMALWFGYTILFPPGPVENKETQVVADQPAVSQSAPQEEELPVVTSVADPSVPAPRPEEVEVVVDTEMYRAVLSSVGARITEFTLKGYRQSPDKNSPLMKLVEEGPQQLYTVRTFGNEGLALAEDTPFSFQGDAGNLRLSPGESRTIRFVSTLNGGAVVEKIYTFHATKYFFDVQVRYANTGDSPRKGSIGFSLVNRWDDSMEGSRYEFVGPTTYDGEDIHNDAVDDLEEEGPKTYQNAQWTAFGTKYFVSIVNPRETAADHFRVEKTDGTVENKVVSPSLNIAPGESITLSYLVYMGPKDMDLLKAAGSEFEEIIDFGFFAPISRPLLHFLKFIYRYLGNYGMAIILLTVIIKAIFWPLTQKSYSSMKGMQKLQPQMQKIREKYKNDRERLNRELMELYKENRVNPLGGCLPMLVQIPVFFALYKVLLFSIELRHAPFAFWITDLSAKDPYYITPLLMGATMFLQQKMTPSTMDPTQAKIFMIMPVVFTFLFLNFPSGLVIYWLVNNVLTIGQQFLINRKDVVKV